MNSENSMDATVLMRKLVEKGINTTLLIEFYEEVAENERVYAQMVHDISSAAEIEERQRSLDHIDHFCVLLKELLIHHGGLLGKQRLYVSEHAKRANMIKNASRFLELLEKDCNIQISGTQI